MPTFRHITRYRKAAVGGLGALVMAVGLYPAVTVAQQSNSIFPQFHSYVPGDPGTGTLQKADSSWKEDMDRASSAWQKRKYKTARKYLQQALEKGEVTAAWYLGHLYHLGRGVKRNPKTAFNHFRTVAKSYDGGSYDGRRLMITVDSLVRVADFYRDGSKKAGVQKNWRQALDLYNMAQLHGHPGADYGLAVMNLEGNGITRNRRRGIGFLSVAARKRFAPAKAMLGDMNWDNVSDPEHRVRGLMWYILARETANPAVHRRILKRHDVMMANSSDEERALAHAMAVRWSKKHPVRNGILQVAD